MGHKFGIPRQTIGQTFSQIMGSSNSPLLLDNPKDVARIMHTLNMDILKSDYQSDVLEANRVGYTFTEATWNEAKLLP